ncbi:MerR family transcriptional regulator [Aquabacterium sp. A7-Y]|uniref:chaperone modulator CbpM n=1 Tax=Aquabacterium sp. A7-Y TaxID=1349605 RepID=UPI00223DD6C0|nr:chaperone modulator CbpM [Aquabacterium sp. A7-Y]MCW7537948.1 MerR family transcriptional regulator [Aquabacterium sp. A7-Y]
MSQPPTDRPVGILVEEQIELSIDELGRACRCSGDWIVTLVREGVLEPADLHGGEWRFGGSALKRARRATRLLRDLELDVTGLALALDLLDRIDTLQQRLAELEHRGLPPPS